MIDYYFIGYFHALVQKGALLKNNQSSEDVIQYPCRADTVVGLVSTTRRLLFLYSY
jgi:hypothetical protein